MKDPVVIDNELDEIILDEIILDWIEDTTEEKVADVSLQWIFSETFLTERMEGLERVEESSLTIESVEE